MSNPEQAAFRSNDSVDENALKQNDATANLQKEVMQARVEQGDKVTVKDASDDTNPGKALLASMDRIQQLAGRLPADVLYGVIDGNQGYVERTLLTGLDPRDPNTRDAVLNMIKNAVA